MTGRASPRDRLSVSGAFPARSISARSTPAGTATTRAAGTPEATTMLRMASPLVMTRSASQR